VEVTVDARLEGDHGYTLPRASELSLLEPLGEANPEPVFEVDAELVRAEIVGNDHLKLSLRAGGGELSAFGFEMGAKRAELLSPRVRVWGALRPDTYRGNERVELRLMHVEAI
jgi:single-stranded DNA-specific DHH superfamily exonuclease